MFVELTPAQQGIIALIAEGCLNKEIAHRLGIAEATVKVHVGAAIKRTGLKNRVQLAVWYMTRRAASATRQMEIADHGVAKMQTLQM